MRLPSWSRCDGRSQSTVTGSYYCSLLPLMHRLGRGLLKIAFLDCHVNGLNNYPFIDNTRLNWLPFRKMVFLSNTIYLRAYFFISIPQLCLVGFESSSKFQKLCRTSCAASDKRVIDVHCSQNVLNANSRQLHETYTKHMLVCFPSCPKFRVRSRVADPEAE